MIKKVVLIHGWEGSPENEWLPWVRAELLKKGFEVIVPVLPNSKHPELTAWLDEIEKEIGLVDEETLFVGHSLGCVTVLQFISKRLSPATKIGGAVFVAGFSGRFAEPQIKEFYAPEEEVEKTAERINKKFVIYSDNDEWVTPEKANHFGKLLGAETVLVPGKGHFSEDDGIFELPELIEVIEKF